MPNRPRRSAAPAAAALAVLIAGAASAQARYTPDISGYWTLDRSVGLRPAPPGPGPMGLPRDWILFGSYVTNGNEPPPLRPEALAAVRALEVKELAGAVADEATLKCLSPNNFDFMSWGDPVAILARADAVVVLPEKERALPRSIYLGAAQPAKVALSVNGHSVGRWEGDNLVVDTVGLDPSQPLFFGDYIPHSTDLHVTERMHLENGGQTLAVQWLFDDPKVFTRPWRLASRYNRLPFDAEAVESVCDVDHRGTDFGG
jgi:hypothetical protein